MDFTKLGKFFLGDSFFFAEGTKPFTGKKKKVVLFMYQMNEKYIMGGWNSNRISNDRICN